MLRFSKAAKYHYNALGNNIILSFGQRIVYLHFSAVLRDDVYLLQKVKIYNLHPTTNGNKIINFVHYIYFWSKYLSFTVLAQPSRTAGAPVFFRVS